MFSKNLKFYRLKKRMTKKMLAELCGISPMAITYYENGKRYPDKMETVKSLAKALNVRVSDFLRSRISNLVFSHGEFRKNKKLSQEVQEQIVAAVEEYFSRFFSVVNILGEKVLVEAPKIHSISLSEDIEENAMAMRRHLKLSQEGALENLVEILESKGILIFSCKIEDNNFSAMNGLVNGIPYIVFNNSMSPERNRSSIAHELAHIFFKWPACMSEKKQEELATAIGGAFLCSSADLQRELGVKRNSVTKDMLFVCVRYGVSMFLLVKRAEICGIISKNVAKNFYVRASSLGWRKKEPVRIKGEKPLLFRRLVYRAVSECNISIEKGAELLEVSYNEVKKQCYFE